MKEYNGNKWGNNGPHILSRVFHEHCKLPNNNTSKEDFRCDALDMQIYPISKAYAIRWAPKSMNSLFDPQKTEKVLKRLEESHFVHFISSLTGKMKFTKNSTVAYRILAERSCPKIFEVSDINFE
jgi:lactosylceramide 4-alpha-galactosyltransferase